jgi:hypothetical protein
MNEEERRAHKRALRKVRSTAHSPPLAQDSAPESSSQESLDEDEVSWGLDLNWGPVLGGT